ncbi:hypothetical protein VTK56DRAFT_4261 [Thermocarpiscus australiensis]
MSQPRDTNGKSQDKTVPPSSHPIVDTKDGYPRQDWTKLFVESVQSERRRREEHTTDTQRSIQAYTSAAKSKIRDILGDDGSAFLGRPMSLPSRPRTGTR